MAKHTQGPLTIHGPSKGGVGTFGRNDDGGDYAIRDSEGRIIGEAYRLVDYGIERPAEANARLWAAAWEMYELLLRASRIDPHSTCVDHPNGVACPACIRQDIGALLAKIEAP